ncbi:hypothetical protein BV25DRAFT_1916791 [Artomyces pyxidatus]|uniref:Uncharacterized protein n=1 Tax=Artomyces pyxidatus TaxID=48021 RepID=A0ACB8SZT0_9AGAM|nr:hypothetical protein BV25DRAFT_1916791 [Artomyces pyxidatus]
MATLQDRPFSKDYSGLINQSVIAGCIVGILVTAHEFMKRKRRGRPVEGLGSVESWEFGYLYQGRSWAKNPSPPTPKGWPLAWVKEVTLLPEDKLNELRGVDAALYIRWLRACMYYALLQTFTTVPILLPIHVHFSDGSVSPRSMTRASISSLVGTRTGMSLLWIHLCLLFWVTLSWMATLIWIARGAFHFRKIKIDAAAARAASTAQEEEYSQYHPHPHPQYPFQSLPTLYDDKSNRGLRLRTVMVTNVPLTLRSEKELTEYFQYYLSRRIALPSVAITSSTRPGFVNKAAAYLFNHAKHIPDHLPHLHGHSLGDVVERANLPQKTQEVPVVTRVVIARKMTELASLLERREEFLRRIETAHIGLAKRALSAVKHALEERDEAKHGVHSRGLFRRAAQEPDGVAEAEQGEADMDLLIKELEPFLDDFGLRKLDESVSAHTHLKHKTIWEALHALPRHVLDPYQPLVHLSTFFRGKTVPAIDYYAAKLSLLTLLITENRAKAVVDYDPVSTAFVTFATPSDARRACKYLAVHPNNPLMCVVAMAPGYEDLDWTRIMKSTYKAEFIKDWVVNVGVWAFTLLWLFPVSFLVTLVSIQNISAYWPGLYHYLQHHDWEEELIQSFLPTLLVSLLTLLIPILLLLIAKKAHTIFTLSELHDRIMTRYYKFLIVNVLVFFCVGTATLQSFLVSFATSSQGNRNVLNIVSSSFPSAGPFYVGWMIFTTGIHSGLELSLYASWCAVGLPLFMYPSTKRQITPRKRTVRIRPRTFNYYYWLPNHLLVIHVILVFSVLNPLVIPFGFIYFMVEKTVITNQLLHVYAKNYEANGRTLLIRMIRYSLDGLVFAQGVFLAYMAVLRKEVNVALSAVLIVFTVVVKIVMTRICRAMYERDDLIEANIICGFNNSNDATEDPVNGDSDEEPEDVTSRPPPGSSRIWDTLRLSTRFPFAYATFPTRARHPLNRRPNPFPPPDSPCIMEAKGSRVDALDVARSPMEKSSVLQIDPHVANGPLASKAAPLVSVHPPHPTWNDESDVNHPYDNPYYTQPITDSLWLPRNPCGLLDLDDTVDVQEPLTTTPQPPAQIESWLAPAAVGSGTPAARPAGERGTAGLGSAGLGSAGPASPSSLMEAIRSPTGSLPRQLSGREEILLPSRIASRVGAGVVDEQVNVDYSLQRRPSLFNRNRSSSRGSIGTAASSGRPYTNGHTRPFTSSTSLGRPYRGAQSYFASTSNPLDRRAASHDPEAAVRPDAHMQVAFATASVQSLQHTTRTAEPGTVTAHEAVFVEVKAEERVAAEERLRQEEQEVQQQTRMRPWWSRAFFSKAH